MFFEMGAPVLVVSMVAWTGDVCAAAAIERKRTASNTAGLFHADLQVTDCIKDFSEWGPGTVINFLCRSGVMCIELSIILFFWISRRRWLKSGHGSSERTVTDFGSTVRVSRPPFTVAVTDFGTTELGDEKVFTLLT